MKFWNLVTFNDKINSVKQKYLNDYRVLGFGHSSLHTSLVEETVLLQE